MKALLIDAAAREVRAVELNDLSDLQRVVGGYIECAGRWPSGDCLFVDEEGLLKPQRYFFRLDRLNSNPLAGNGIVVGPDRYDSDGEWLGTAEPVVTVAELQEAVRFLDRAQMDSWGKANASEPSHFMTSAGRDGRIETTVFGRYGETIADIPKPEDGAP